jgi:hypothetical protein
MRMHGHVAFATFESNVAFILTRRETAMTPELRTIEDLEAEILTRTRESLDSTGHECARLGHVWKVLETNAADRRPAEYCPICFSVGAERELVLPVRTTTRRTGHALATTFLREAVAMAALAVILLVGS